MTATNDARATTPRHRLDSIRNTTYNSISTPRYAVAAPQLRSADVCADALTPAVTNDPTVEEESQNTFNTMAEAASSSGAFTHGLAGPELAAHERKRKVLNLKDDPVRGHNKQGRKTKEPNVTPEARISQFPNQSLRVDNGKLFCVACGTDRSLRLTSLKIHLDSNVMSCRDICQEKTNIRHRHLPKINKHLRQPQAASWLETLRTIVPQYFQILWNLLD